MHKIDKELSDRIIKTLGKAKCRPISISGNNYFVKKDGKLKKYLGYKLAKLVGLKCIEYEVIIVNDLFYVIS